MNLLQYKDLLAPAGVDEAVAFKLTRSDSGPWPVHRVAVPGGNPDLIPWSAPGGAS